MKTSKISTIILWAILGCGLGILLTAFHQKGYFERWQSIAPPKLGSIKELISSFEDSVYVKTSTNQIFLCNAYSHACDETPIEKTREGGNFTKPCSETSTEFGFPFNYPANQADCLQSKIMYAEGNGHASFVIDSEGVLWSWAYWTYVFDGVIFMFCGLCIGAVLGLFIALIPKRH